MGNLRMARGRAPLFGRRDQGVGGGGGVIAGFFGLDLSTDWRPSCIPRTAVSCPAIPDYTNTYSQQIAGSGSVVEALCQ